LKGALVLDIGTADGDLAFFLESIGFRVIAIDYPGTNFNGMRGIQKLKEALNSRVEL
jgi:tRNA (mo5U34)-methyltransferase